LEIFWSGFLQRCRADGAENHPGFLLSHLVPDFHFQPGVAAFGRKPHSSFFPKQCGGLPTAATTAGGPSALSEGRVPRAPGFWASQGVAELRLPKLAKIYSAQLPVTGMVKTTGEGARPGLIAPKRE